MRTHEQDLFALLRRGYCAIRIQINLPGRSAGTGRKPAGDGLRLFRLGDIEDRGKQLVQLIRRIAHHGRLPVDELLLEHVHGELEGGGRSPFAVTRLQHEQLAVLDGELDVLNVLKMLFERGADLEQFRVAFWHQLFQLEDGLWCAHARDHVFSLGIDQKLAVELVGAVGRVAGKCDARARVFAGVPVNHRLHVDRCAPVLRDVVFPAIDNGAIVHPGTKDGTGGPLQLVPGIVRESPAGAFFHQLFETSDQLLVIGGGQL